MSRSRYAEDCPGCRPVAIDMQTGEPCRDDHPLQLALAEVWQKTPRRIKKAFHRVTCLSSRNPVDVERAWEYMREVYKLAEDTFSSAPVEKPDAIH